MVNVSVIVPTYNGAERIGPCLDALNAQRTSQSFEIVVVDDGSTDDTENVVQQFPGVRLVKQSNQGPGAARNTGVAQSRGEIVVFTDDDCEPEPDWLDQLIAPLHDDEISASKGAYHCRQRSLVARFVQVEYEEKYDNLAKRPFIDFIDTYAAAFRRDAFEASGGYDARFTTASTEDQELSFRMANAGHRMVFVPAARVWHQHVDSLRGYMRKKFKIGYWKVLVLVNNPNKVGGDAHTPKTLLLQVGVVLALPPSVALSLLPGGVIAPLSLGAIFAASAAPLTLRCFRRDPAVGLVAPLMIGARATALAAGLGWGFLSLPKLLR